MSEYSGGADLAILGLRLSDAAEDLVTVFEHYNHLLEVLQPQFLFIVQVVSMLHRFCSTAFKSTNRDQCCHQTQTKLTQTFGIFIEGSVQW